MGKLSLYSIRTFEHHGSQLILTFKIPVYSVLNYFNSGEMSASSMAMMKESSLIVTNKENRTKVQERKANYNISSADSNSYA